MKQLIRLAEKKDVPPILDCIAGARAFMKDQGSGQWQGKEPSRETIERDIALRQYYVYQRGEDVCGGFALMSIDPDYPGIFDGRWLNERPYVVIHRFVVSPKVHRQGIGQTMLAWIEDYARKINIRDIRLDTHEKNVPMIGLLQKLGYRRCGKVLLQRTLLREAYHKALEDAL